MKGFVYIMMNPSYQGIVKIGKTCKDPEERARELSSSTGVATPFIVVYKREFYNCDLAEKIAHAVLTEKGYRVNDAREFFNISIPDAIDLILNLPNEMSDMEDFSDDEEEEYEESLAESYYRRAEDCYYGYNDTFEDEEQAIYYYEESARLGYKEAYRKIGKIWKDKGNTYKAIRTFQEGANKGDYYCYAELGKIYMDSYDDQFYHKDNANLTWRKFFECADRMYSEECSETTKDIMDQMNAFILLSQLYNKDIELLYEEILYKYHKHLISYNQELKNLFGDESKTKYFDKTITYLTGLREKIMLAETDSDKLSENYLILAKEYMKGKDDLPPYNAKTKSLLNKSIELGNKIAYVYLGIWWLNNKNRNNADKAWRDYYNDVYDLFENNVPISDEQQEILLNGFCLIFEEAIEKEETDLIHQYYLIAVLKLGFIEYAIKKLEILNERIDALNEKLPTEGFSVEYNDTDNLIESTKTLLEHFEFEKEKLQFTTVYSFVRDFISEMQNKHDNGTIMMYRLEK
ncbi:MAG: GIY-YIG nuclease family protein [Bacteroidaceae bacterium]|nr:GIY-YIG nuclease family protein [Bacteroidaceae bacterium]